MLLLISLYVFSCDALFHAVIGVSFLIESSYTSPTAFFAWMEHSQHPLPLELNDQVDAFADPLVQRKLSSDLRSSLILLIQRN